MRSALILLALPLLSSARPQNPGPATVTVATTILASTTKDTPPSSTANTTPQKSNPPSNSSPTKQTTTTDPNALAPSDRAANFAVDYASLIAAQRNNTLWTALQGSQTIGSVPRASAAAQENAYISALSTATGDVPQPAYITGLPADQKAYMESFNKQVASIANVDFRGVAPNTTSTETGKNGGSSTGGAGHTTPGPSTSPASPTASPTSTTSSSKGMGVPSQPTGVYKMAAGAAMGVLGVAAFL